VFAQHHVTFASDLLADYLALQFETPRLFFVQQVDERAAVQFKVVHFVLYVSFEFQRDRFAFCSCTDHGVQYKGD